MVLASSKSYSKLLFDENGVVMIADPIEEEPKTLKNNLKNIKFDENGILVSEERESGITDISNQQTKANFKFDEDGTVIGE